MARNANQSNHYDYTVVQEKLFTPEGVETDIWLNRRTDIEGTAGHLGYCTDQYGLFQNSDVIEQAESALDSRGLTPTKRETYVSDNGARCRHVMDFEDHQVKMPNVGDVLGMRLMLNNSFDRSLRLSFTVAILRLVCSNGMRGLSTEFALTKRHSKKTNIDDLITDAALDSALAAFEKTGDIFSQLADKEIEHDSGLNILQNLAKKNVFSEKVREGIAHVWNNPLYNEDEGRNLYNLYNAGTQYLTREVAPTRFEYSERVSEGMVKALRTAAADEGKFTLLSKALPVPEADLSNN